MNFVKTYRAWVVLAVILVGLLVVQFWVVADIRQEALMRNAPIVDKLVNLESTYQGRNNPTTGVITQGDIDAARDLTGKLRDDNQRLLGLWREYTAGLNWRMSGGRDRDGRIFETEPDEDGRSRPGGSLVPISWNLFPPKLAGFYEVMIADAEKALAARMEVARVPDLADEYFAADKSRTRDEADRWAQRQARVEAERRARIFPKASSLSTLDPNRVFRAEDREVGWAEWRRYLVYRDLLGRVIVNAMAEVDRELWSFRDGINWPGRREHRFVERVIDVKIDGPTLGNGQLPALGKPDPGATGNLRYYDRFTVRLEIVAHIKVVEAFIQEMLRLDRDNEDAARGFEGAMFYVPRSLAVRSLGGSRGGDAPGASDPTHSREPAVVATLEYWLYRFRFEDTDNSMPPSTGGAGSGGRGGPGPGPGSGMGMGMGGSPSPGQPSGGGGRFGMDEDSE